MCAKRDNKMLMAEFIAELFAKKYYEEISYVMKVRLQFRNKYKDACCNDRFVSILLYNNYLFKD